MKEQGIAEYLKDKTIEAQKKLENGGAGAIEAHFELNKISEIANNSDEIRGDAENENIEKTKKDEYDEIRKQYHSWDTKIDLEKIKNNDYLIKVLKLIVSENNFTPKAKEESSTEKIIELLKKRLIMKGFSNEVNIEVGNFENNTRSIKIITKSPINGEDITIDTFLDASL